MSLQTNVTSEYLRKAFEFSVDYYLNPNKVTRGRTSSQERRIGQIIDDFITGKVIELGVVDILKEINPEKEFLVDLDVHDNPEYEDPDIVGVNDNNSKRKPNVFIEIKNDARENRWTGLFEEQFETMKQHDLIKNDLSKLYIIYASVKVKGDFEKRTDDLFGIYLSNHLSAKSKSFEKFIKPTDMYVEIDHVITGQELIDNGAFFLKKNEGNNISGDSIWEADVLRESNLGIITRTGQLRKGASKIPISRDILPLDDFKTPEQFGEFKFSGEIDAYKVKFGKSASLYIKCLSNVVVKNKILGEFCLERGKQYQIIIKELMPCGRNNLWIAKRNLNSVTKPSEQRMKEIAKKI